MSLNLSMEQPFIFCMIYHQFNDKRAVTVGLHFKRIQIDTYIRRNSIRGYEQNLTCIFSELQGIRFNEIFSTSANAYIRRFSWCKVTYRKITANVANVASFFIFDATNTGIFCTVFKTAFSKVNYYFSATNIKCIHRTVWGFQCCKL